MALLSLLVIVLAACGVNKKDAAALEKKMELLVEENKQATEKISMLEKQIEELESQLAQAEGNGMKEGTIPIRLLKPDAQFLNYEIVQEEISTGKLEDEIQQALAIAVSNVPVRSVKDHSDGTVTIDFDRAYVSGPHLTSSAQVGVFLDQLKYVMNANFPQIKSYYLRADGEPTSFGETIVFTDAISNVELVRDEMYLPIKEKE